MQTVGYPRSHRYELRSEQSPHWTRVYIKELSTGKDFRANVPREYHFHLSWIGRESAEGGNRGLWLLNVLDCFVDELLEHPSEFSSWRSSTLNPLLVRTFFEAEGDGPGLLRTKLATRLQTEAKLLGVEDWKQFYHNQDVIGSSYDVIWMYLKPQPTPGQ